MKRGVVRSLKIDNGLRDNTAEVWTRGNFSRVVTPPSLTLSMFLVDFFYKFEEQFGLKILNWEVLNDNQDEKIVSILIHHEPTEKAIVAHPPEPEDPDEPDVRL